ncbi:hypothetical protein Bca4012_084827 [Brassica carinata]
MAQKLDAKGGEKGDVWDDGVHENVRKVYAGKGQDCIAFVKFEYVDDSEVVVGDEHGEQTQEVEEFEVDDDDYIVYVEAFREKVTQETIVALKFETYKGKTNMHIETSPGVKFVLQGGKIVGFHGRSTDVLHSLGAYVSFSSTLDSLGNWIKVEQNGEGPGLRCSHAIAQVGNKIYSFGGEFTPNVPIDKDLYVFDLETKSWSIAPATGDIPHLSCLGVRMVSVGSTLYVFGGRDASRNYNGESFSIRGGAGLQLVQGKVWVVYGFNGCEIDDVHYSDPVKQVETFGEKPSARSVFASAVVGKHIVLFGDEIAMDPQAHVGPGQLIDGTFALNTETLKWERLDKFVGETETGLSVHVGIPILGDLDVSIGNVLNEKEKETPDIRGWSASTSGTVDGKKGLLMHGGKAVTNDRFDDLFFYEFDSA